MQKSFVKVFAAAIALCTALVVAPTGFAQGLTTSAITGTVKNASGEPIAGATVTILHEPSGTRATTTTRANGQYDMSGLRVGGPYTVTATAPDLQPTPQTEVYLELGQTSTVDVTVRSEVVKLQEFTVTADRDTTFGSGNAGTGTTFSEDAIDNVATVRRNVQDIARLDSRMFLGSLDQGGQLSAQGQNFRYNSFLIDGVQAGDAFGLNSNGFSSLRGPIPIEALQSLTVEFTPYDVRRAGFAGALINAVTKSGTNQFRGELKYEFTNEGYRAENPITGVKDKFDEKTWVGTFGGPIIRNKLFFFLSYEDFTRTTVPPNQNFLPDSTQIAAVTARASAVNYTTGDFGAANETLQESSLAKLDWNITDNHRLSLTYRKNEGQDTVFSNFSSSTLTSFSNYWYDQPRVTESWVAQLNSNWTSDFRTELSFSTADYDGSPKNRGAAFPEVTIQGLTGVRRDTGATITNGQVRLGTEFSRQLNEIYTTTNTFAGSAEYSAGNHTFLAGFDYEGREVTNKFVQAFLGSYTFRSLADWQAGNASSLTRAILAPGATIDDAIARFDINMLGLYVQDTWKPNSQLTVGYGIRFDDQLLPTAPRAIPDAGTYSEASFQTAFGRPSTSNPDGQYTISPRVGFTYELDTARKTQIRGSLGLYQGRNPLVWLSNAYSNRGVVARQTQSNVTFNPNVTPGAGVGGIPVINLTDPKFRQPTTWKANIAVDHQTPFSKDWIASVELGLVKVDRSPFLQNLNLKEVGTMPDGRIRYAGNIAQFSSGASRSSASANYGNASLYKNPTFADVYYFTNTKQGGGYDGTVRLFRPMKNKWSASLSYTHSRVTETGPMTSSVAQSNYNGRAIVNPNEDRDSISNTNIDDKIVLMVSKQFEFIKKAPTTIAVIYEGRTGRPYSWVFNGDANGDGFSDNDLFYVPTGPDDPKVTWTNTTERDNFFAFVNNSSLGKHAGKIVPRNSERSPWNQTIDLKFTQALPIYKRVGAEFYVNIINFANMIDKDWGILDEVPFSFRRSVAGTTINSSGQYVYTFTGSTLDGVPTVVDDTPASRWQVQMGVRLKF